MCQPGSDGSGGSAFTSVFDCFDDSCGSREMCEARHVSESGECSMICSCATFVPCVVPPLPPLPPLVPLLPSLLLPLLLPLAHSMTTRHGVREARRRRMHRGCAIRMCATRRHHRALRLRARSRCLGRAVGPTWRADHRSCVVPRCAWCVCDARCALLIVKCCGPGRKS